jgi:hypothetical protein
MVWWITVAVPVKTFRYPAMVFQPWLCVVAALQFRARRYALLALVLYLALLPASRIAGSTAVARLRALPVLSVSG